MWQPAKVLAAQLRKLGAQPQTFVGLGDVEAGDVEKDFGEWGEKMLYKIGKMKITEMEERNARQNGGFKKTAKEKVVEEKVVEEKVVEEKKVEKHDCGEDSCACKGDNNDNNNEEEGGGCCSNNNNNNDSDAESDYEEYSAEESSDGESAQESDVDDEDTDLIIDLNGEDEDGNKIDGEEGGGGGVVDLEDMGGIMKSQSGDNDNAKKKKTPGEMVTPKQAKSLKKEGYKLIGTHSAVKMCR